MKMEISKALAEGDRVRLKNDHSATGELSEIYGDEGDMASVIWDISGCMGDGPLKDLEPLPPETSDIAKDMDTNVLHIEAVLEETDGPNGTISQTVRLNDGTETVITLSTKDPDARRYEFIRANQSTFGYGLWADLYDMSSNDFDTEVDSRMEALGEN